MATEDNNQELNEATKALEKININKETKDETDEDSIAASAKALADPSDFAVKHHLQNRWTLWYDNPGKKTNSQTWGDNLKRVVTFDTVEDFWRIFNNIRPASKLSTGSNYHLFKEHIEPKWEHQENQRGGKWIISAKGNKEQLDKTWLWLVLACIGENFEDEQEICGCVVSIRKGNDRVCLWTKTATNETLQKRIGNQVKKVAELDDKVAIGYQVHSDSMKRGSSYNNRNKYEV